MLTNLMTTDPLSEENIGLPDKMELEDLVVANTYLQNGSSMDLTCRELELPSHEIYNILKKAEIKRYIDHIFLSNGYRNRDKIAKAFDTLIDAKMEEMDEAEITSSKDIAELLMMVHKIRMDETATANPKNAPVNQKNTQINVYNKGNYGKLMEYIITGSLAKEAK